MDWRRARRFNQGVDALTRVDVERAALALAGDLPTRRHYGVAILQPPIESEEDFSVSVIRWSFCTSEEKDVCDARGWAGSSVNERSRFGWDPVPLYPSCGADVA